MVKLNTVLCRSAVNHAPPHKRSIARNNQTTEKAANQQEIYEADQREKDYDYIVSIKAAISIGKVSQGDIRDYVVEDCSFPRRKVVDVIKRWDKPTLPGLWHSIPGEGKSKIFKLND